MGFQQSQHRISAWNFKRNHNSFNFGFEMRLLSEESAEGYKALAEGNIVMLVDAICDMDFIYGGSKHKFGMREYHTNGVPSSPSTSVIQEHLESMSLLTTFYNEHISILLDGLIELLSKDKAITNDTVTKLLNNAMVFVCDANDKKPIEKDSEGKGIKGVGFVPPDEKIKEYLEAAKLL